MLPILAVRGRLAGWFEGAGPAELLACDGCRSRYAGDSRAARPHHEARGRASSSTATAVAELDLAPPDIS
jgi:hypothetical protein